MDTIGKRIAAIRGNRSRDDFAALYGVHRNTLAKWEADGSTPSADILHSMADGNGVPIEWLLHGFVQKKHREPDGDLLSGTSATRQPTGVVSSSPVACTPCAPSPSSATGETDEWTRLRSDMDRYRMEWMRALDDNARLQEEVRVLTEENKRLFCENVTLRAQVDASRGTAPSPQGKRPKHARTEPALQDMDPPTDIEQYGLPPEHCNRR